MEHRISHRDLRNKSAEVLRGVADGDTYVVTNHGVPAARVVAPEGPMRGSGELVFSRPATRRDGFDELKRVKLDQPSMGIIDALRDDR